MVKSISADLRTAIRLGTTTLAHIWKITRKDGTILRFTDLDQDIVMDDGTYVSDTSFTISAVSTSATGGAQSADIRCMFDDDGIAESDVVRGVYDAASVEISVVNYSDPTDGKCVLLTGQLGSIETTNRKYGNMEVRGLLQRSNQRIGEYYSAECRADLGDARCTVDLATFTDTGVVTLVNSPVSIRVDLAGDPANAFYSFGVITWLTGDNANLSMEVLQQTAFDADEDTVKLSLGMPHTIQVGDTFEIVAGCDKRITTCKTKFNNIANFRGEAVMPGENLINERPVKDEPRSPQGGRLGTGVLGSGTAFGR